MKPILFNTREVQATLGGRMTAVRRPIFPEKDLRPFPMKNSPYGWWFRGRAYRNWNDAMWEPQGVMSLCRYKPGDILYVRETFATLLYPDGRIRYVYKATDKYPFGEIYVALFRWHPSVQMPKEAARIFLRVTNVSVAKLQDIITGDYKTPININREGLVSPCEHCTHNNGDCKDIIGSNDCCLVDSYISHWNSTIKKANLPHYGWNANPWVWVIEFERISKEEALKNG